jgi:putative acetyltransferase
VGQHEDPYLDLMYEEYNKPKYVYWRTTEELWNVGAPLANEADSICELQKNVFLPETRGIGVELEMMEVSKVLNLVSKKCYLETMPLCLMHKKLYKDRF